MKRVRRTPEEARRLILDAAEASMPAEGPGGLRLMAVAAEAGVTHPTILHHFGSREGLISALNRRTLEDLRAQLMKAMRDGHATGGDLIRPAFAAYRGGLAQRVVWMLQTDADQGPGGLPILEEIVAELHALRLRLAEPGQVIDEADTRRYVHLVIVVAFGDALIGPRLRGATGPAEEIAARDGFERWFIDLLHNS
ncbi:TetR/AcrR family transcriptional regulator [Caulobacter segnis]